MLPQFLTLTITALYCCNVLASYQSSAVEKLAEMYGYHADSHDVVTPDGYILTIQRLSKPHAHNSSRHRSPVLVGHALMASSELWIFREDENLALQLVDHGFDVWLANFRGTPYGVRHRTLSPKSHEFWDFSWHENGVMDQAAMIDYVLNTTGHARLFALSYSMSCTATMVLLSERPEYNAKIIANVFFAPAAFFKNPAGWWHLAKTLMNTFPDYARRLRNATGGYVINDKLPFSDVSLTTLCPAAKSNTVFAPVCKMLSDFFEGKRSYLGSDKLLRGLTIRFPSGASIRQGVHYAQSIQKDGEFRKYDFGSARNFELYGSSEPPSYNLTSITSPIHIYCGLEDVTVSVKILILPQFSFT
ncbi:lipase 1-like isoform X2 [Thrips palmi]|uniref:Lipase 1-like isoform X2 n=1 Tax=Thrips palmi TaxID=161013 RepID=A0A6P8YP51_THRPL|nr:lipase 1-like isoform X2 [Thrips palmi]